MVILLCGRDSMRRWKPLKQTYCRGTTHLKRKFPDPGEESLEDSAVPPIRRFGSDFLYNQSSKAARGDREGIDVRYGAVRAHRDASFRSLVEPAEWTSVPAICRCSGALGTRKLVGKPSVDRELASAADLEVVRRVLGRLILTYRFAYAGRLSSKLHAHVVSSKISDRRRLANRERRVMRGLRRFWEAGTRQKWVVLVVVVALLVGLFLALLSTIKGDFAAGGGVATETPIRTSASLIASHGWAGI